MHRVCARNWIVPRPRVCDLVPREAGRSRPQGREREVGETAQGVGVAVVQVDQRPGDAGQQHLHVEHLDVRAQSPLSSAELEHPLELAGGLAILDELALGPGQHLDHQAVLGQPDDDLVEDHAEGLERVVVGQSRSPGHDVLQPVDVHPGQGHDQVGLRRIAAIDGGLADARPLGHLRDGGVETVLGEDLDRRHKHAFVVAAGIGSSPRPTRPHRRRSPGSPVPPPAGVSRLTRTLTGPQGPLLLASSTGPLGPFHLDPEDHHGVAPVPTRPLVLRPPSGGGQHLGRGPRGPGLGAGTLAGPTNDQFELSGIESTEAFDLINERSPRAAPDGATARVVFGRPPARL